MNIIQLKELKPTPDIVHEYTDSIKFSNCPLVIDNGSYQCRVGWASQAEPQLVFKNLIAKPRKDRSKKDVENPVQPPIQIGNDIVSIEAVRFQLRTQFDRNVVTHYHIQEQIFDYIFTHLGINESQEFNHPIVMTECFANPNYCRQLMSELLFECYNIPAIVYGVDSLFSFHHNSMGGNGLILSCGYNTTHVIPVLNGTAMATNTRRINLGGFHMVNYLHRLLQLKYPVHVNAVTLSRIEEILHTHCTIAYDYMEQLRKWATLDFYEQNVKKIQLQFTQAPVVQTMTAEQKFEKKKELARRLAEINARRREEKLQEDEKLLQRLILIHEEDEDDEAVQFMLEDVGLSSVEELTKTIAATRQRIDRTRVKILQAQTKDMTEMVYEEAKPKIPQPPAHMAMDEWIVDTKIKRNTILERKQARRQRRQDLAKRRTAAAQERMRIISQLARKEKGTDNFGMRDEDWDVYKAISREGGDSDSEAENEKLIEFEEILRHHDPDFEEPQESPGNVAELNQLHIGVELQRGPELLFQPSMIGSGEAGLAETINYVLQLFGPEEQQILADNVYLTGACSKFPGLMERLDRELLEMRPYQTTHHIYHAKNPSLDAWYGARDFASLPNLEDYLITRSEYEEYGGEYLKEYQLSNPYFPTPPPINTENEGD